MSTTAPHEADSTTDDPLLNLLFCYPDAEIILRSQDSYHFRLPKIYITNNSPTLGELIQRTLVPQTTPLVPYPPGNASNSQVVLFAYQRRAKVVVFCPRYRHLSDTEIYSCWSHTSQLPKHSASAFEGTITSTSRLGLLLTRLGYIKLIYLQTPI
jgi:hypothetical protein